MSKGIMFNWWFKKKDIPTILSDLSGLLFPQLKIEVMEKTKVIVDYSVDANLEAVLNDVVEGKVNQLTIKSLEYVINKLVRAREILEADRFWPNGINHYAVKCERQKDVSANEPPLDDYEPL